MKKVVFSVEPLSCPSCIKKIETTLEKTEGVLEAKVLFHSNKVRAQINEELVNADELAKIINKLGYPVRSQKIS